MSSYSMQDFRVARVARDATKTQVKTKPVARGREGGRRESWETFCARIVEAAELRLQSLVSRKNTELMFCPWCSYFGANDCGGRCNGGRITAGKLRTHYERMVVEYGGAK
jgi:hypothetical protein